MNAKERGRWSHIKSIFTILVIANALNIFGNFIHGVTGFVNIPTNGLMLKLHRMVPVQAPKKYYSTALFVKDGITRRRKISFGPLSPNSRYQFNKWKEEVKAADVNITVDKLPEKTGVEQKFINENDPIFEFVDRRDAFAEFVSSVKRNHFKDVGEQTKEIQLEKEFHNENLVSGPIDSDEEEEIVERKLKKRLEQKSKQHLPRQGDGIAKEGGQSDSSISKFEDFDFSLGPQDLEDEDDFEEDEIFGDKDLLAKIKVADEKMRSKKGTDKSGRNIQPKYEKLIEDDDLEGVDYLVEAKKRAAYQKFTGSENVSAITQTAEYQERMKELEDYETRSNELDKYRILRSQYNPLNTTKVVVMDPFHATGRKVAENAKYLNISALRHRKPKFMKINEVEPYVEGTDIYDYFFPNCFRGAEYNTSLTLNCTEQMNINPKAQSKVYWNQNHLHIDTGREESQSSDLDDEMTSTDLDDDSDADEDGETTDEESEEDNKRLKIPKNVKYDDEEYRVNKVPFRAMVIAVVGNTTGNLTAINVANDIFDYIRLKTGNDTRIGYQLTSICSKDNVAHPDAEGLLQMWVEGVETYHLIDGYRMKKIWGDIMPHIVYSPKNLDIIVDYVRRVLEEDEGHAHTLNPYCKRMRLVGGSLEMNGGYYNTPEQLDPLCAVDVTEGMEFTLAPDRLVPDELDYDLERSIRQIDEDHPYPKRFVD